MFTSLFHSWVRCGCRSQHTSANDVSHIRISNIIALIIILILVSQLPVLCWLQPAKWQWLSLNILLHSLLLCLVPSRNQQGHHQHARYLLVSVYISYLLVACLLWQQDLGIQYFLLIGVFVSVFFYPPNDLLRLYPVITVFCLSFLLLELNFMSLSWRKHTDINQYIQARNALLLVAATIACATSIYKVKRLQWRKLAIAHRQSESLLTDILPVKVSQQLKGQRTCVTEYFPQVSILFADMQNFTGITEQCSMQQLVAMLNQIYSKFDEIAAKYGLQKIKTNGDQYMAVAGIPHRRAAHARLCCAAALEMMQAFNSFCAQQHFSSGLRIGIGSGAAIAGVIGRTQAHYDIWGQAVNLAARLESQGKVNRIQVAEHTQRLAAKQFSFTLRGTTALKGMGKHQTFWLRGKQGNIPFA